MVNYNLQHIKPLILLIMLCCAITPKNQVTWVKLCTDGCMDSSISYVYKKCRKMWKSEKKYCGFQTGATWKLLDSPQHNMECPHFPALGEICSCMHAHKLLTGIAVVIISYTSALLKYAQI